MAKSPTQAPRIHNRKAAFHYEILEKIEAGIALTGSEVKSLRAGKASLEEAYAYIENGQASLRDCNINTYENAGYAQHVPTRPRPLLLHRREIARLHAELTQRGLTLIPLSLYFNEQGRVKVLLGLCRGKKLHDKRDSIRKREDQRDIARAMRRR